MKFTIFVTFMVNMPHNNFHVLNLLVVAWCIPPVHEKMNEPYGHITHTLS